MTVSVGSTITAASYNDIRDTIATILNPTQTGYGADLLQATTATTNMQVSAAHWAALRSDINKCIKHQTGVGITAVAPAANDIIAADFVNALESAATAAVANRNTVHPSQLSSSTHSAEFTNAVWNSEVQSGRTYAWDTELEAYYHFNLGGYITSSIGVTGSVTTATDLAFLEFVQAANGPGSDLSLPYNRDSWVSGSVVRSFSADTSAGVFTATITYSKELTGVNVISSIVPPASITTSTGTYISLVPISSSTLYFSIDAIPAKRPGIEAGRRILSVNPLAPFVFSAGKNSDPQILTIRNLGAEPIAITSITATSNGVLGYVLSNSTQLAEDFPFLNPLTFPININSNDEYEVVVFYQETVEDVTEVGTFYNSITIVSDADQSTIVVPTTQIVNAPEFDFELIPSDPTQSYTYDDWQTEYGLSEANKQLGINIANRYYLPNTAFGLIDGIQRYGLFRKPDAEGLKFWVDYTNNYAGGDYFQISTAFFRYADLANFDSRRSRTPNKYFDAGFAYTGGDFYDKTLVDNDLATGNPKIYVYNIKPQFGSINVSGSFPGYTVTLSNQEFNGTPSSEAEAAFSVAARYSASDSSIFKGPSIMFTPSFVNNTGTYSTDVTVAVTATDLDGDVVTKVNTATLAVNLTNLADGNLATWLSGFETNNAVLGMSYDRIGGKLYLTVGLGSGADGAPTLDNNNYLPTYVNASNLGIAGDQGWGQLGYGTPQYKINDAGWGAFMNTYAVWPHNPPYANNISSPPNVSLTNSYRFRVSSGGTYTVEFAVDDWGYVSIRDPLNDQQVAVIDLTVSNPDSNWKSSALTSFVVPELGIGETKDYIVTVNVRNSSSTRGNPGGVAAAVRNPANTVVWSTLDTVRPAPPYLYWPEVYRIPIEPNVVQTYQLANHLVKNFYPVGNMASGFYTYSRYFGTPGTASAGSLITVDSDGKGNLSFSWNPQSSSTGDLNTDTTLANFAWLPFYYSEYSTRKRNVDSSTGANTRKLVGMSLQGARTISVPTPGYGQSAAGLTTYIPGVPGTAASESIAPGFLYNATETKSVRVGYYAPVSKHWVSEQTGDKRYAATRSFVFKHPQSTITNQQVEEWGFDAGDVLVGRDFKLTRVQITLDHRVEIRYGIMNSSMTEIIDVPPYDPDNKYWLTPQVDVNDTPPSDSANLLTSFYHPGDGRGTFDEYGPWAIPDPAPNQLIYLVIVDGTNGARGFNDCTLTLSYTKLG